jgi:hypothetical protein
MATTKVTRMRPPAPPPAPPTYDHEAGQLATPPAASPPGRGPKRANKETTGQAAPASSPGVPNWATMAAPPDEDFWEWLSNFTEDDWQYTIAYIWRVSPITDKRTGGKPVSTGRKYTHSFDIERVLMDEGSGTYRVDVCRINPTGAGSKRVAKNYFTAMNMNYPPRVPVGEWLDFPENEMWRWAEPKMRAAQDTEQIQQIAAAVAPAGGSFDPSKVIDSMVNAMTVIRGGSATENAGIARQLYEMVKENQDKMRELMDPTKQLATLRALLDQFGPKQDDSGGMISFLREELRANREEMKELRNSQNNRRSLVDEIREFIPMISTVKSELMPLFGGFGAGRRGTDWAEVFGQTVNKLVDHVPEILQRFKPGPAPAPTPPVTALLNQPDPAKPGSATQQQQEQTTMNVADFWKKWGRLVEACIPFMLDQYSKDMTGYEFRDWFLYTHGVFSWNGMKTDGGSAMLVELSQQHPQLKTQLAPKEKFEKFTEQFFTPQGQEEQGLTDDDTADPSGRTGE